MAQGQNEGRRHQPWWKSIASVFTGAWIASWFQQSGDKQEEGQFGDLRKVVTVLYWAVLLGFGAIIWQQTSASAISLLWALACFAVGGLTGFLFGIPRVVQREGTLTDFEATLSEREAKEGSRAEDYRQRVNTNLEQISDWLTKIIVGIGLVELKNVPRYLESVADFMASESAHVWPAFAGAVIVYFSVIGFLSGYLLTRLFLQGAFSRADRIEIERKVSALSQKVEAIEQTQRTSPRTVEPQQ